MTPPTPQIIRPVKDDLGGWGLRRLVWVADRGFASAANRAYLARGGGRCIHAEKLRHTNTEAAAALAPARALPRPSRTTCASRRSRSPPAETATATTAPGPRTTHVICHNRKQGKRDQQVRGPTSSRTCKQLIEGSDGLDRAPPRRTRRGSLQDQAGAAPLPPPHALRAAPRRRRRGSNARRTWTASGCCAPPTLTLTPDDLAAAYKQLLAVERGWRDFKGALGAAPGIPLPRGPHPRPHPAVLARAAAPAGDRERHRPTPGATSDANSTGCTWSPWPPAPARSRNAPLPPPANSAALRALDLPEPPRFFDFTLPDSH